jgi:predicted enzyme related to lactoylglutathione lyase
MSGRYHGNPCWYELTTGAGDLTSAEDFYRSVLGWTIEDSGMEGFDYHLAKADGAMVAGMMAAPEADPAMPPFWLVYFAVDDADAFATRAEAAGARVHRPPADIPGTGRFAILSDPQGAAFGVLQPDVSGMSEAERRRAETEGAFHPGKAGHANWNELMSSDPEAAFDFYSNMFGWTKGEAVGMGDAGVYQLVRRGDVDIAGMMGLGQSPVPNWLPYFGVAGVSDSIEAITKAGGKVHHGPMEVPGGFIAVAQDPQGAWFAVTGETR